MRKSEVLLSVAFVGSALCSLWLWQQRDQERAQSAELRARLERITPGQSPTATAVVGIATQTIAQVPADHALKVVASQPASPGGSDEERDAHQRKLMSDPQYRDAWREQRRVLYARRRDNLIRVVGLTAEQADAVIDLQI